MLRVNTQHVNETISILREAGKQEREGLVFWLGTQNAMTVQSVLRPEYVSGSDFFQISREEIARIVKYLRQNSLRILAQVHSHPAEAFHSLADDRWAIVRHNGAISIVLPYFCEKTTIKNFSMEAVIFECQSDNWLEVEFHKKIEVAHADR